MIINEVVCDNCGKRKSLINNPYANSQNDDWHTLHREGRRYSENLLGDRHFCCFKCVWENAEREIKATKPA